MQEKAGDSDSFETGADVAKSMKQGTKTRGSAGKVHRSGMTIPE
jgi:hypothetical protein